MDLRNDARGMGHASLDHTRRYLDATAEGLHQVVRGHAGQVAAVVALDPGGVRSTVELGE